MVIKYSHYTCDYMLFTLMDGINVCLKQESQ